MILDLEFEVGNQELDFGHIHLIYQSEDGDRVDVQVWHFGKKSGLEI